MKLLKILIISFWISIGFSTILSAQRSGIIMGKVIDGYNNEPLAYANIHVKGTTIGTVTNEEGLYRLENVPAGEQIIVISFIGFADQELPATITSGELYQLEPATLQAESIMGEEVIITALMRGQIAALNKQANSNTIVNIVSKDNIEGVPDMNAAESISRLPGISLARNGGEGSKVTIRGVSPRFNSISVNGIRVPATGSGDRSVDLSMISSDILEGIEVFKAITPDMDADAIGGSINLLTKTADPGLQGRVHLETGYHGLIKDIGTYKGSVSLGNRFLNNRIGLLGAFTYHRANRNTDVFDASYELQSIDSAGNPSFRVKDMDLQNRIETRDRYNASFTADYKMKSGKIVFDYFYTLTEKDKLDRNIHINQPNNDLSYGIRHEIQNMNLHSFQLRGNHDFNRLLISYSFSHSRIGNEVPLRYNAGVERSAAFESGYPIGAPPHVLTKYIRYELDDIPGGSGFGYGDSKITDRNYTGQLDLKVPLFVSGLLNGYIKAGGKIRQKYRDREINSYSIFDGVRYYNAFIAEYPDVSRLGRDIYVENFLDSDFEGYTFAMGPSYVMPYAFDDEIKQEHYDKFAGADSLWRRSLTTPFDEFIAHERIMAGYLMAEINIGNLMILPGIRFEQDFNEYTGTTGYSRDLIAIFNDTTGSRTIRNWLPMFHVKYNFSKEFNIRLAATKTMTRPDFMSLTPFERINYAGRPEENIVQRGSLDLDLPTSWNYDVFFNYYSRFGLVSMGAFYKKIENVDIDITYVDYSGNNKQGDPDFNPTFGMSITNPINSEHPTTVWGAEFELQTNFRWLPKPFDGIVLNANYSLINSETYYPFFPIEYLPPTWLPSIKDTSRVNRLPGQANHIVNVTLGYEKKGFSARVTMNYQGNKLTSSGRDETRDKYSEEYLRWDAVVSQEFGKRLRVMINFINFTNEPELTYSWRPEYPTASRYYGWAVNLAVRYDL